MENNEERNEFVDASKAENPILGMNDDNNKNNKTPKTIILIILVLAIVIGAGFLMKSILFASNAEKFVQLATKDQKFLELIEEMQKEKQINTTFKVDLDKLAKEVGQESEEKIGEIKLTNVHINEKDDFSNVTKLNFPGVEKEFELQIAKTGKIVGFNLPEITDKFVAIDLDDTEGLIANLEKLGVDSTSFFHNNDVKEQSKKLSKMMEKYIKIIMKEAEPFIMKSNNVEVAIDGNSEKTTEYRLTINEESFCRIALPLLKEFYQNEEDMKTFLELSNHSYANVLELKDDLVDIIAQLEDLIEENDFEKEEMIIIKLYEKKGKNIATVIQTPEKKFGFYVFEDGKDYTMVLDMEDDYMDLKFTWELKDFKNKKEGMLKAKGTVDDEKFDVTLLEYEQEILNKKTEDLIKVSKNDYLLLNTATEKEIEKYMENIYSNLEEYSQFFGGNGYDIIEDDLDFDDDILDNTKKYVEVTDGYLKRAIELSEKVTIGMTEEEVIRAIGEPSKEYSSSSSKSLYYSTRIDNSEYDLISVFLYNGKVTKVSILVTSSEYKNVFIGKELNAELDDLEKVIDGVKEGMALDEVEKILGKAYFKAEKEESESMESFIWYDAKEQNVRISFMDGKVFYIGMVW